MDSNRPSLNGSYYNYFNYTGWYFKENILASLQSPVGLKITGVSTQGIQFHSVRTQLQRYWLFLLAGSFDSTPRWQVSESTQLSHFQLFSQVLSFWPEPFCAGKNFAGKILAAAASALDCKCKPKSPALFLFSLGDSRGDFFSFFVNHNWKISLLYLNKTAKFGIVAIKYEPKNV